MEISSLSIKDLIKYEFSDPEYEDPTIDDWQIDPQLPIKKEKEEIANLDWCIRNNILFEDELEEGLDVKEFGHRICLYKCTFCTQVFRSREDVYRHNLTHLKLVINTLEIHPCNYCRYSFCDKNTLQSHIHSEHPNITSKALEVHVCHLCSKSKAYTYKNYKRHVKSVHGHDRVTCEKCNKTFKCKDYYQRHGCLKTAIKKEITCKICKEQFCDKATLKVHFSSVHMKVNKIYKCYICSKMYNYKNFHEHTRAVHGQENIKCEKCNAIFKSVRYYKKHSCVRSLRKRKINKQGMLKCDKKESMLKCNKKDDGMVTCDKKEQGMVTFNKTEGTTCDKEEGILTCYKKEESMLQCDKTEEGMVKCYKKEESTKEEGMLTFDKPEGMVTCDKTEDHMVKCDKKEGILTCDKKEEGMVTCEECGRKLLNKSLMTHHLKNVHNLLVKDGRKVLPTQKLDCEQCGSKFKSVPYLRTHMRRVHYDDGKLHPCMQCGKKFKSPRRVRIHEKNSHKRCKISTRYYRRCETCSLMIAKYIYYEHVENCKT